MINFCFVKNVNKNSGMVLMVSVLFLLFISAVIIAALVTPSLREYYLAKGVVASKQSFFLSESGLEDAYYRIKEGLSVGTQTSISMDGEVVITNITDSGLNQKTISSQADYSSRVRGSKILLSTGEGVSFNYGIQVGQGGIYLEGSSGVIGNVYANGPIYGESSTYIEGSAISANAPAGFSDQSNGSGTPENDITFGAEVNEQDIAQSFEVSTDTPVNKFSFYLKKIGNPSNATVKLVTDNGGFPSTSVIASGNLSAATVTPDYGWIDVSLDSNPKLTPGLTYWVVIDASKSQTNYYVIGASNATYDYGEAKIGKFNGSWLETDPSYADLFFSVFLGGMTGIIQGISEWNQMSVGLTSGDSAQAHTVKYVYSSGDIYCKEGEGNNASCIDQADPVYQAFPISEANIEYWKDQALLGGTLDGDYSVGDNGDYVLGPKHITGNLEVGGGATLYLTGPLWVDGNISVDGLGRVKLDSSYGEASEIVVTDGVIANSGSGSFEGSGFPGSYILAISTSNCDEAMCGGDDAIEITGDADSVVLYAPNGTVRFTGSAQAKEAIGHKVVLTGSSTVTYDTGLVDLSFQSGPSGGWEVNEWVEVVE